MISTDSWKAMTTSTQIAVALSLGLGSAFALMTIGYGGPILVQGLHNWFGYLNAAGLDVADGLAHLHVLTLFGTIAGLAALRSKPGAKARNQELALYCAAQFALVSFSFAVLNTVGHAAFKMPAVDALYISLFSAIVPSVISGFVYMMAMDGSSRKWTPYGMAWHLCIVPSVIMAGISRSPTALALTAGLWLMLALLPDEAKLAQPNSSKFEGQASRGSGG